MCARLYLWASTCHETHTATDTAVWVHHCADKRCAPQQSLMIVVPGRILALMMTGNVSAERSATRARQVSPIPAWHQQKCILSRATGRNYTFAYWSIYHVLPTLPPSANRHLKRAVKDKSKWSSTLLCSRTVTSERQFDGQNGVLQKNWRVGEWCLTWNASAQSNGETA